jgi:hypothetical protein
VVVNVIISVSPYYVFRACRHVSDINLISDLPCYVHPLNATEEAWSFRRTLSNSPFICGSFCIPQYFLVFINLHLRFNWDLNLIEVCATQSWTKSVWVFFSLWGHRRILYLKQMVMRLFLLYKILWNTRKYCGMQKLPQINGELDKVLLNDQASSVAFNGWT